MNDRPPITPQAVRELIALARQTGRGDLADALESELDRARRLGEMPRVQLHDRATVAKFDGPYEPGMRPAEIVRSEDLN